MSNEMKCGQSMTPKMSEHQENLRRYVHADLEHYIKSVESSLAESVAAIQKIRNGCDDVKMCCGNPTEGGGYAGFDHPPDPPQCCGEPEMLHDICDAIIAKHSG